MKIHKNDYFEKIIRDNTLKKKINYDLSFMIIWVQWKMVIWFLMYLANEVEQHRSIVMSFKRRYRRHQLVCVRLSKKTHLWIE